MTSQHEKCIEFASLHQQTDAFIIANPWDIGSAKLFQGIGFKALATTSAGLAYTLGRGDGEVSLKDKLKHCSELAANTTIPINADFENGFADGPEAVASNVRKVVATGIAGCSIEDFNRDSHRLYDFDLAVERVQAAAEVVATLDLAFQLTARVENLIRGVNDLDDTIKRLQAFETAGADVLYAPGISSLDQLKQVTSELSRPFNVLAPFIPNASVDEFAAAGAKRISVGGALNWAAVQPLLNAGKEMLTHGTFNWTKQTASAAEVNQLLKSEDARN